MANPTSNFNWQMPTPTDLVTDLPADFEVFGQAVDSSMADLLGGTTGQILAKNSNTNMDFVWVTNDVGDITAVTAGTGISGGGSSGAVTITNSMATAIDAKGDLIAGTGSDAFARIAVGANNTVLTADSTTATGLKWAAPGASTAGLEHITTVTFNGVASVSLGSDASPIFTSTYDHYRIMIRSGVSTATNRTWSMRMRSNVTDNSNANYGFALQGINFSNTAYNTFANFATSFNLVPNAYYDQHLVVAIDCWDPFNAVGTKITGINVSGDASNNIHQSLSGLFEPATVFNGFSLINSSGNFDDGTISVYGYRKA